MKLQPKGLVSCLILFVILMSNFDYLLADSSYGHFKPSSFSIDKTIVLVEWNSDEGMRRLSRAAYKDDFYELAHVYQPQINPLYCGIASSVIVLNAMRLDSGLVPSQKSLEVKMPEAWGDTRIPFREYSQITFLNEKTDRIKPREKIDLVNITEGNTNDESEFSPGLTLAELKGVLEVYNVTVCLHYAAEDPEVGTPVFRQSLKATLSDRKRYIIVNFVGKLMGAPTGGHISPIVAYDEPSDTVLILDVAGHKNPWYWAPVSHLYQAMHSKDRNTYRGWITVEDSLVSK